MNNQFDVAKRICHILKDQGFIAFFAGGWVRDYIMKNDSDDIDIATNATPVEVIKLFEKTIKVGVQFGVVIVVLDNIQFEVATFRKDLSYLDGRKPEKICFSTTKEDAFRRDFTINGLFFDPLIEQVFDYVNGIQDIEKKLIRAIGDPKKRFEEDRLRMIRAVRFKTRFQFEIEEKTLIEIKKQAHTLFPSVSKERILQEFQKMHRAKTIAQSLYSLYSLGLLQEIFPYLKDFNPELILKPLYGFPEKTPLILFLAQLFRNHKLEKLLEIFISLKFPNNDLQIITLWKNMRSLICYDVNANTSFDKVEWTHLFSKKDSLLCLAVICLEFENKENISQQYLYLYESLKDHINRVCENRPLVSSQDLTPLGIKPGKLMGDLLKEAEKITITENINDKKKVLDILVTSSIWPKNL